MNILLTKKPRFQAIHQVLLVHTCLLKKKLIELGIYNPFYFTNNP